MTLDPDEKELLESFERGEWRSVDANEVALMRELARNQLGADVRAGSDALSHGEGCAYDPASGQNIAEQIKQRGRSTRSTKV